MHANLTSQRPSSARRRASAHGKKLRPPLDAGLRIDRRALRPHGPRRRAPDPRDLVVLDALEHHERHVALGRREPPAGEEPVYDLGHLASCRLCSGFEDRHAVHDPAQLERKEDDARDERDGSRDLDIAVPALEGAVSREIPDHVGQKHRGTDRLHEDDSGEQNGPPLRCPCCPGPLHAQERRPGSRLRPWIIAPTRLRRVTRLSSRTPPRCSKTEAMIQA